MGRGGYNGGSPSVTAPKLDQVLINDLSKIKFTEKSWIFSVGCGLQNEEGGVQPEFGYIVSLSPEEETPKASVLVNLIPKKNNKRVQKKKKLTNKKSKKSTLPDHKWVPASYLLEHAPELAKGYHLANPDAPKPYGLE